MKKFNSSDEIIKDPHFIDFVSKNINELRTQRIKRPEPKPGFYYKRDWYDRMIESGNMKSSYFIKNIEDIWSKKSTLSSEIRGVILYVCNKSFHETLVLYAKNKPVLTD